MGIIVLGWGRYGLAIFLFDEALGGLWVNTVSPDANSGFDLTRMAGK